MIRFAILLAAIVFAQVSQAAPPERFVCGSAGGGDLISVQVDGPRYGDAISLELWDDKEVAQMLLPVDQVREIHMAKLTGFLQHGSCKRGAGNILVSCALKPNDWGFVNFSYRSSEEIARGVTQGIQIERHIGVKEMSLVVKQIGRDAHLTLKATLDDGIEHARVLSITKKLGTLDHDWFMCNFK